MSKIIVHGLRSYVVDQKLGGTDRFTLYRATSDTLPDQQFILKIATGVTHNGALDREAFLLRSMGEEATRLEEEFARVSHNAGPLNYQLCFPQLIETFIVNDQGGRRVVVMGFAITNELERLAPIAQIRTREHVRVDPMTSAWIMGKLLKILVFAHSQEIAVGNLSGENILIERDHHCVTIFDWSAASFHKGGLPHDVLREEIRKAAREVVLLLGGDPLTGKIPDDDQLKDGRYAEFLGGLARDGCIDARKAHSVFYEVVEALWGRKFHPYTSYPLTTE